MIRKSSTGSRPSVDDTSMTCTSTRVRSRWLRNRWPSPCPWCAPSIRPGTSATTNDRSPDRPTTPRLGTRVVNGYAAIFGFAAEMREMIVDLPAFG
jgi:hypothetical protein